MTYLEARSKIRSGDLLAWSHRSWGSWYDFKIQMVRMFTRSEYCHVGVAWVVAGRVFVLEAVSAGVRIFPLSLEVPFYWVPMKFPWTFGVEKWAMAQAGKPYSQIRAILAGLRLIKIGENTYTECAEYAHEVYKQAGIDMGDEATPTAIVRAAQSKYSKPLYLIQP